MNNSTQTQNALGQWVPAIPEPWRHIFGRCTCCSCGRKFKNREQYEGHYALKHILYPTPITNEDNLK